MEKPHVPVKPWKMNNPTSPEDGGIASIVNALKHLNRLVDKKLVHFKVASTSWGEIEIGGIFQITLIFQDGMEFKITGDAIIDGPRDSGGYLQTQLKKSDNVPFEPS